MIGNLTGRTLHPQVIIMAVLLNRQVLFRVQAATEAAAQRALVAEAHRQLDRAVSESNPSGIRQFVDGVEDRAIEAVKSGGVVHFEFFYTKEIVQAALDALEERSPIASGKYIESHAVYLDGMRVDNFEDVETASRVIVSNTVDYARVIERGLGKRVPWSKQPQVPREGVYANAVKHLRRRFGNVANIRFGWVGADEDKETGSTVSRDRFPAIIIERR